MKGFDWPSHAVRLPDLQTSTANHLVPPSTKAIERYLFCVRKVSRLEERDLR
jgi:hypothetical protein